jgi:hypothetical protein
VDLCQRRRDLASCLSSASRPGSSAPSGQELVGGNLVPRVALCSTRGYSPSPLRGAERGGWGSLDHGLRFASPVATALRPSGARSGVGGGLWTTGCALLHPWLQPCAPPGRGVGWVGVFGPRVALCSTRGYSPAPFWGVEWGGWGGALYHGLRFALPVATALRPSGAWSGVGGGLVPRVALCSTRGCSPAPLWGVGWGRVT